MLPGNDHGEDAYGILEPNVNTENIDDGKHYVMLSFHCRIKTYCVISIILMSIVKQTTKSST